MQFKTYLQITGHRPNYITMKYAHKKNKYSNSIYN